MAEDDFAALRATAALFPDGLVESELGKCRRGGWFQLLAIKFKQLEEDTFN